MIRRTLKALRQRFRDTLAERVPGLARSLEYGLLDRIPLKLAKLVRAYEAELFVVHDFIEPGTVVVDVGANVGRYVHVLDRAGRYASVVALEPIPRLHRRLTALFPKVRVLSIAASDRRGKSSFVIPEIGGIPFFSRGSLEDVHEDGQTGSTTLEVTTDRLDDVLAAEALGRVGFIKIDVEGHEKAVLTGALETIRRDRPVLLVEIEKRHHPELTVEDVAKDVLSLDYECFFFDPGPRALRSLTDFDPVVHQSEAAAKRRVYLNNFFFFPAERSPARVARTDATP